LVWLLRIAAGDRNKHQYSSSFRSHSFVDRCHEAMCHTTPSCIASYQHLGDIGTMWPARVVPPVADVRAC
jgi:hypothetical protein